MTVDNILERLDECIAHGGELVCIETDYAERLVEEVRNLRAENQRLDVARTYRCEGYPRCDCPAIEICLPKSEESEE